MRCVCFFKVRVGLRGAPKGNTTIMASIGHFNHYSSFLFFFFLLSWQIWSEDGPLGNPLQKRMGTCINTYYRCAWVDCFIIIIKFSRIDPPTHTYTPSTIP